MSRYKDYADYFACGRARNANPTPEGYARILAREAAECPYEQTKRAEPSPVFQMADDGSVHRIEPEANRIAPVSLGSLICDYPRLHPPIIDGLLRAGETANLVSTSKVGKSWAAYGMGLSVVTGGEWLGEFPCTAGKVLIVDNELHAPTIANRVPSVARAMGIEPEHYQQQIDVLSLRGRLLDLHGVIYQLERIPANTYKLVILDAWYRSLPAGMSENDNAAIMSLYNEIDRIAQQLNVAWVNIHHSSKGSQSEKSVTDVGSGAGSQSRAADCHCVLRAHEEEGVVVLEAAVRSFAPVTPLALRWDFPLWVRADDVDPALLKGRLSRQEEKQQQSDKAGLDAIIKALLPGPLSLRKLMASSEMGQQRVERLATRLAKDGQIEIIEAGKTTTYQLKEGA